MKKIDLRGKDPRWRNNSLPPFELEDRLRCVEEYRRERVDVSRVESVYSFDRDEIENTSMEAHVAIDQASSDPYLRNNRR